MKKILNNIDNLENNIRTSAPKPDVESCPILVSGGKVSHLKVNGIQTKDSELYIYWVNEVLSNEKYNGKISTIKSDLSDSITQASKVFFAQNWNSSRQRDLLNAIRAFVRGKAFEYEWGNDIYSSIAAVLAKGDDWQGLLQFMRQKEMFDYRIAFSFYGVLNGFANLSRDFTDILFNGDQQYTWTVYKSFYGQLLSRNIPDLKSEEIDDLPSDEDMPDFTAKSISSLDTPKELTGAEHGGVNPDLYYDTKLKQSKGVQKKIKKDLEEVSLPKKKKRKASNQEDSTLNLFPSTGKFLMDFDFLVNNSEFQGLASMNKEKWENDLRWFIDAHRQESQNFEYYKDKPTDNETVIRQFVSFKSGIYKQTEEWLKKTYSSNLSSLSSV